MPMDKRVNLRLAAETLEPYERLAELMTKLGQPTTPTQLIRLMVEINLEQVQYLGEYAQRAVNGDREAAHEMYNKLLDWNQSHIEVAREVETRTEYPERKEA